MISTSSPNIVSTIKTSKPRPTKDVSNFSINACTCMNAQACDLEIYAMLVPEDPSMKGRLTEQEYRHSVSNGIIFL